MANLNRFQSCVKHLIRHRFYHPLHTLLIPLIQTKFQCYSLRVKEPIRKVVKQFKNDSITYEPESQLYRILRPWLFAPVYF